MPSFFVFFLTN